MGRILKAWVVASAVIVFGAAVEAQVSPTDKAAAEALFDQGLSLMHEGKFADACARFEESQAIESGIGTQLYLAECYERLGRTASSWATFREAASQAAAAGQQERADAGRRRAERLEPQLSKLMIDASAQSALAGLEILRNGSVVPRSLWGLAVPVDPGTQRIEVRAPGHLSWFGSVEVKPQADSVRVTVPALQPAPTDDAPDEPAASAVESAAPSAAPPRGSGGMSTPKWVGLITAATGVGTLAVGGGFGIRAILKNNDAEKECDGKSCSPRGLSSSHDANQAARVANGLTLAGGVLVVGGLLTYFLGSNGERATASVDLGGTRAALNVRGVF